MQCLIIKVLLSIEDDYNLGLNTKITLFYYAPNKIGKYAVDYFYMLISYQSINCNLYLQK